MVVGSADPKVLRSVGSLDEMWVGWSVGVKAAMLVSLMVER